MQIVIFPQLIHKLNAIFITIPAFFFFLINKLIWNLYENAKDLESEINKKAWEEEQSWRIYSILFQDFLQIHSDQDSVTFVWG